MIPFHLLKQHDEWGNAPSLLDPKDKDKIEKNDWVRAGGDVICPQCQKDYYHHPQVIGCLWLRRLCNGDLVKL